MPYERQWAHAVGVAIGAGYMAFARFDGLRLVCFDDGHCVLEADHISFYVESRKNGQFEGSGVTIAHPASGSGAGVFGLLRELKMRLGLGVLGALGGRYCYGRRAPAAPHLARGWGQGN